MRHLRIVSLLAALALPSFAAPIPPVDEFVLEAGREVPAFVLQQAPAPEATPDTPAAPEFKGIPNVDNNTLGVVVLVAELAKDGRWAPAILIGLFGLVGLFRKYVLKAVPGNAGDWLRGKWGGWLLNALMGLSGAFGSATLFNVPMNAGTIIGLLGSAATFTFGAAGFNELLKDLGTKKVEAADAAAASASAGVNSLRDAAAELRRGPPQS